MQKQKYFNLFCSGYADFELLALFSLLFFYLLKFVFPALFFSCALYEILCHKHQTRSKRKLCAGNTVHA